ncbi:MAG: PAS domain-containing protein [Gemmatimonadetes bacterium]|nr:PAS domain-containing protein [Gemmatimonadota bacterium]
MTFAGRLVVGTILVLVFAIVTLVMSAELSLRRALTLDLRATLEREATLAAAALGPDSLTWQPTVERLGEQTGLRVTVIDSTGRVRAESEEPEAQVGALESHANRPEVKSALAHGVGSDQRLSRTLGAELLYVAVRGGPGVVRVASDVGHGSRIVERASDAVFGSALLALVVGIALAFFAGRSIAQPLTRITQAAHAMAQGTPPRFPRSGVPDVDALVHALREMHEQLEQRFAELRAERAESAALVEAMVEGVIAADERGRIVTANGAARRLLGYRPDEPLPALDQLFRTKQARELVAEVQRGQEAQRQIEFDSQTVLLTGRPLGGRGALLVLHDVTELRRLEAVRRDFVANVSHELKTPLTSISGYAETLVGDQTDPATTRRFLEVILANSRRMQRLVDDLLDLSRIESGGWRPQPEVLDVGMVGREVWTLLAARAEERGVRFAQDLAVPTTFADPDALRQVLSNLMDNALRYTPRGGTITLRTRREDDGVRVSVRDTGSGITGDHLPRIFERFYRADPARSREEGGTGLGLAIVKHMVEGHGGSVRAESEFGRGSEISAWFPDAAGAPVTNS